MGGSRHSFTVSGVLKKERRRRERLRRHSWILERQTQAELQLPPDIRGGKRKRAQPDGRVQRRTLKSPKRALGSCIHIVHAQEVGAVEDVEAFGDEIQAASFGQLESTGHTQVNIEVIRTGAGIAAYT